ncbi:LptF/LptG family permease [Campylobacter sp.]|uniref:LptF/LptG family permease n=1 Tax=Campylobacter sp. TaxID=205 RepID=UPI002705FC0F|nr:LptF/LptG family permease [Campylobacter sp.]
MNLYAKYVGWLYFKSFFVIFLALIFFYVGIDVLTNLKDMPTSANLKLLYLSLTSLSAINYVLPLSLIFALIVSKFSMIRSNELVSLYALGLSKNSIVKPPFIIAFMITLIYVGLNFTPFAYSYEFQRNLIKTSQISRVSSDLFLKFEGKFIYIKELNPVTASVSDIRIFEVVDGKLLSATFGNKARFSENKWIVEDVNITAMPQNIALGAKGLEIKHLKSIETLEGFKPKTIENAYQSSSSISILDAIDFIFAFEKEGVGLNTVKSTLYNLAFSPFFAPFMVLIIYYFLPVTGRFFNLALTSFVFIIVTLCVWGALFVLMKFAHNGVILPEAGVLLPLICIFAFAIYLYFKHR